MPRCAAAKVSRKSLYDGGSKAFFEAGKKQLSGDTARQACSGEVKDLRREMRDMKEWVAELSLANRLLKKGITYMTRCVRARP